MWSAQEVIYYVAPAAVAAGGLYLLYRATQVDGTSADRAFALGAVLVLSAWGFTAARSSIKRSALAREFEDRHQVLANRVRELKRQTQDLQNAIDSRTAAEVFLAAMERADEHRSKNWVHIHHAE